MNENRRQILNMLAANKITAEEAERLLTALESGPGPDSKVGGATAASANSTGNGSKVEAPKIPAKYLRVQVEADGGSEKMKGPVSVNIRVPMQLLRAGVRLASLIPAQAHQHLDDALSQHGVPLTLSQIKPENLEELIDHLGDLTIDVAAKESQSNVKVRVFSE
jgi:SHOCT-like protein